MRRGPSDIGKAVDLAAAAVFAAAMAFASAMLASNLVAAIIAPLALVVVYAGLRRIADGAPVSLPAFDVTPIEARPEAALESNDDTVVRLFEPRQLAIARPSAASPGGVTNTRLDAGQALSDALAQLKRSLR